MTSPENLPSQILDEILTCLGWLERMTPGELHELANIAEGARPEGPSVHESALLAIQHNLLGKLAHTARYMATERSEDEDAAQD